MKICSVDGCGRKHAARGLCKGHHRQVMKGRELTAILPRVFRERCEARGCGRPHVAMGLCRLHYDRRWVAANRERLRSYAREQRASNPDIRRRQGASCRAYYHRNVGKFSVKAQRYYESHKEQLIAAAHRRVAEVTESYARACMGLRGGTKIPLVLLEAKRAQLQLTRLINNKEK